MPHSTGGIRCKGNQTHRAGLEWAFSSPDFSFSCSTTRLLTPMQPGWLCAVSWTQQALSCPCQRHRLFPLWGNEEQGSSATFTFWQYFLCLQYLALKLASLWSLPSPWAVLVTSLYSPKCSVETCVMDLTSPILQAGKIWVSITSALWERRGVRLGVGTRKFCIIWARWGRNVSWWPL
jgi:hypothetical protein